MHFWIRHLKINIKSFGTHYQEREKNTSLKPSFSVSPFIVVFIMLHSLHYRWWPEEDVDMGGGREWKRCSLQGRCLSRHLIWTPDICGIQCVSPVGDRRDTLLHYFRIKVITKILKWVCTIKNLNTSLNLATRQLFFHFYKQICLLDKTLLSFPRMTQMSHHRKTVFLYTQLCLSSCKRYDACLISIHRVPFQMDLRMLDALSSDIKRKKVCYFANPLWTSNIITAVNSSWGRRNEWASLFYYYYFWHGEPHTRLFSADRRSLPRWQWCYNLLYNKHIFQAFQPVPVSLWAGTRAKQCITSHRLTSAASILYS